MEACEQCDEERKKVHSLKSEMEILSKLAHHLEKRTQEQEDLILLLKQSNMHNVHQQSVPVGPSSSKIANCEKSNNTIPKNTQEEQKTFSEVVKTKQVSNSRDSQKHSDEQKLDTSCKHSNNPQNNYWKTNKHKQGRRAVIGCNSGATETVKTVPKKGYLHVCRISPEVNAKHLLATLKKTAPSIDFECEEWNKNEHTSSYKVTFSIQHVADVYSYNPKIWPSGAEVRRFRFKKNFSSPERAEHAT